MLTDAQRELLVDKYVLWERASREGNMELRDYNRRAAEALKAALMICADSARPPAPEAEPSGKLRCTRCGQNEITARRDGCQRGPCPMEFVG